MSCAEGAGERYRRQLAVPEWGPEQQRRVREASVIAVGAGSLGAPASAYLAAAGVGRIGVVDSGTVELSSLPAQVLHLTPEVGASRAESAAAKLGLLNDDVHAEPYPVLLERMNAEPIVAGADLALDCSNDRDTRLLINEACCAQGVPLVTATVGDLIGTVVSIRPGESACLRCAREAEAGEPSSAGVTAGPGSSGGSHEGFRSMAGWPESSVDLPQGSGGTLGAMAGVVGSIQALEALKLLTAVGTPLLDRVLRLDGRDLAQSLLPVARREGCPACAGAGRSRQSG